jgi:hypothetical protein
VQAWVAASTSAQVIRDFDLPAGGLEPIVYEPRTVHRLDRRADRLTVTRKLLTQAT